MAAPEASTLNKHTETALESIDRMKETVMRRYAEETQESPLNVERNEEHLRSLLAVFGNMLLAIGTDLDEDGAFKLGSILADEVIAAIRKLNSEDADLVSRNLGPEMAARMRRGRSRKLPVQESISALVASRVESSRELLGEGQATVA
ncbi:MAG: hypothetical protein PHZ00_03310 [Candidatus Peribacteraceae bacterium]|nr:hypothetical protein [Candidatus Peribacteraceae bacterium]